MSDGTRQDATAVSPDTVYTQMYAELRRYRDCELTVATWFTVILLAVLGAIVAGKYAAAGSPLGVALERCPSLKWCLATVPILIGIFGAWSIVEAMRSYGKLRKRVTAEYDSRLLNRDEADENCCPFFKPGVLMCALLLFLGIFTAVLIVHTPSALSSINKHPNIEQTGP